MSAVRKRIIDSALCHRQDTYKRYVRMSRLRTGAKEWLRGTGMMLIAIFAACLMMAVPAAAKSAVEELEYQDGNSLYVLLPENYDPLKTYPSVYFMPQDGADAKLYLEEGTPERIRELEENGEIPEMICVFPELQPDEDLSAQVEDAIAAVEEKYPAIPDASKRGVIGTKTGGYLAFLLGYGVHDGTIEEVPVYYSAIASHSGDFTSDRNPYIERYGDICGFLQDPIGSFGADTAWHDAYHTYLDCDSDSALTWEDGGSADIAYLYRYAGLSNQESLLAWDYSAFEYAILPEAHYGTWLDHLGRSLKGFADAFGMEDSSAQEETETEYQAEETIVSGPDRLIDLMGDWYFCTVDELRKDVPGTDGNDIEEVSAADWKSWDIVTPALDWWTEDFALCLNGNPYYMGYAWYIREFEIPQDFDITGLQIEAGMMDEADEVYLNGVRVGQTGIPDEGGSYDGSNPWDEERIYKIPDDLLHAGTNLVCVRICNGSGAGGWYAGPVRISSAKEKKADPEKSGERFYATSFQSDSLRGQEIEYRVYLPEGYYESELRYPVVYMLHGYGSTGKSFEISKVPEVLDEGIASGEIPPCIVIFPSDGHPQKASWWSGAYADMLNKDLIGQVDSSLRTVDDREYRFLAGESMGGGGAYLNALDHPELYGGVFDIYGGLRYTNALSMFLGMDAEQLGQFRHYIICGNHDMYCFDLDHIQMGRHLIELGISYVFEIDNGEHNSAFYLPRLKEGFAYLLSGLSPAEG